MGEREAQTGARATAATPPGSDLAARPRVACFTPLSPVESGISYYSEDILPVLARALDLTVVVDGYAPTHAPDLRAAGVRLRRGREFARDGAFAATIYQMGNSPAHAYMYERALTRPGIVVLHDVVLHHLRLWMAVNGGRGARRAYVDELRQCYGAAGGELARAVLRGQTPATLFDYPLVELLLASAQAVIVHNAASAERVRALHAGVRVRVVPMGVPLPPLPPRDEARARLGLAPGAFAVISHGHVNPYKRLDVALRAFHRLADEYQDARFLIAGNVAPGLGPAIDRQIGYLGLGGRVRRLGFIPPATVADLLAAADCCINLRYPSAGETSASLLRIMGAGVPVLVSDAGSFRELPPSCAIQVPVGPIEEALLAEYLLTLARDEALRVGLGAAAHAFVAAEHSLERSAVGYLATLGDVLGRELTLPDGQARVERPATVGAVPPEPPRQRSRYFPLASRRNRPAAAHVSPDEATIEAPIGAISADPLLDGVADALAELHLAGHEPLLRTVAREVASLRGNPRRGGPHGGLWRLRAGLRGGLRGGLRRLRTGLRGGWRARLKRLGQR